MAQITAPTPLYGACLALATDEERNVILAAGPRQHLYHVLAFGTQEESDNAAAAYCAIKAIVARIGADETLRITGIDSRSTLQRDVVDAEVVLSGRLMWESGNESKLQMEWMRPALYIINLRVEPRPDVPLVLRPSAKPLSRQQLERQPHLRRMQQLMDTGMPPPAAAAQIEQDMGDPNIQPGSLKRWLMRELEKQAS